MRVTPAEEESKRIEQALRGPSKAKLERMLEFLIREVVDLRADVKRLLEKGK